MGDAFIISSSSCVLGVAWGAVGTAVGDAGGGGEGMNRPHIARLAVVVTEENMELVPDQRESLPPDIP